MEGDKPVESPPPLNTLTKPPYKDFTDLRKPTPTPTYVNRKGKAVKDYGKICFRVDPVFRFTWDQLEDYQRETVKHYLKELVIKAHKGELGKLVVNINTSQVNISERELELERQLKQCRETVETLNAQIEALKKASSTPQAKTQVKTQALIEAMSERIKTLESLMNAIDTARLSQVYPSLGKLFLTVNQLIVDYKRLVNTQ